MDGRCPTSASSPRSSRPATSRWRSIASSTASVEGLKHQTLLGATGTGQDVHDRLGHRAAPEADARPRPQQDARRPALRRVPRVLPGQRGRVLRQLLRLLPARGVPAPERHVHREGLVAERRDRPAPPRRDPRPLRAPRRDHRGLRLLHLRPRRARSTTGRPSSASDRAGRTAATRSSASSSTSSTSATTRRSSAPGSGSAATPSSSSRRRRRRSIRVEFFGDEVERITEVDPLTGELLAERKEVNVYPASHYVTPADKMKLAIVDIEAEMEERVGEMEAEGRVLEAARLRQRTTFDLEMMRELGFCTGHRELLPAPLAARGRLAGRGRSSTTSRRTGCSSSTSRT